MLCGFCRPGANARGKTCESSKKWRSATFSTLCSRARAPGFIIPYCLTGRKPKPGKTAVCGPGLAKRACPGRRVAAGEQRNARIGKKKRNARRMLQRFGRFFRIGWGFCIYSVFSDILYLLSIDKGTQDFRGHIAGHGCVKPLVIRPHFFRSFSLPRHARYLLKTRGAECNSVRAVQGRTAQECRRQCKRRAHRNGPNQLLYPKRMRREALLR